MNSTDEILPGSWLGVFGGGQLGRMFTHAAQRLGYHVAVLEPEADCPAGQAANRHFCESVDCSDAEHLVRQMSELCSVITLEFENIPSHLVRSAEALTPVHPGANFLEICQDRIREKSSLAEAGFPTTPFARVVSADEIVEAADQLGWPLVLKTAKSGYDGKGQAKTASPADVPETWKLLGSSDLIAEKWIEFEAEVSMITARNRRGQVECYPLFENLHRNHILDISQFPARGAFAHLETRAKEICRGVAEKFGVIGLFCIEFFVTSGGDLMINEIAPRPHNSGHLTLEAFSCSQFEQQVRAICNLPLVPAKQVRPAAAMANLLGDVWENGEPNWDAVLKADSAHLHLYGKSEPRLRRKMGHITVLDETPDAAANTARNLRAMLAAES